MNERLPFGDLLHWRWRDGPACGVEGPFVTSRFLVTCEDCRDLVKLRAEFESAHVRGRVR